MEARVRPARRNDKAPLMSFIKDVWGGHDYIPYVWDQWLQDKSGKMFVVEVDGVPVGMNRIRFLPDGAAWFEGARVHPEYRGRGLATLLGENSIRYVMERGVSVFRLTSGSRNKIAHRQIAKIRFEEAARFSVYRTPKGMRFRQGWVPTQTSPRDIHRVESLIARSREASLGAGVMWHNWSAVSLNRKVLSDAAKEGRVWNSGEAAAITDVGGEGVWKWEEICFVGGPVPDALVLVGSLLGRVKRATQRLVFLPQGSRLIHALRARGFERDFAMILFERRAAKG